MKTPDLNEIRRDLEKRDAKELLDYCIRLAKFKKENKELFSFLLFDADDMNNYIENVKSDTEKSFLEINKHSIYYIKKSIRKILKNVNKHIRGVYDGTNPLEGKKLINDIRELLKEQFTHTEQ